MMNTVMLSLLVVAGCIVFLAMPGLIIYLLVANARLKARVDRFFGSRSEKYNMEAMLLDYLNQVKEINALYGDITNQIEQINAKMDQCIQRVALIRYNPFDTVGGDLCFALALLDNENNGVVINTIRGRETSFTYAKPIVNLESVYTLSPEEQQALHMAADK